MYDEKYMLLAIEIAEQGRGKCSPNPAVGAVVVRDDTILAIGYTQPCGQDHAEVQAIKKAGDCNGADLYVTLEPCSHYGKTPPCAEGIISAGIKNVFAGIKDPNPKVNGKGFEMLKQAGIKAEYPFFEDTISRQLECYLHWITTGKPFVILKNAVSLDGKIADTQGNSKWITNESSRKKVHELRQEVDAVLTTINTVKQDNPTLNVRLENTHKHPIRIVLDPFLELSKDSNIYKTTHEYKTMVFHAQQATNSPPKRGGCEADGEPYRGLQASLSGCNGGHIKYIPVSSSDSCLDISEILTILGEMKITSLLVEAGTTLNSYMLKKRLVNKLFYFIAPRILGGTRNVYDDLDIANIDNQIKIDDIQIEVINNDMLVCGYPIYIKKLLTKI